jgi:hypothetical protein
MPCTGKGARPNGWAPKKHRLNRGGDRALNRAIYTIATTRMRDSSGRAVSPARRASAAGATRIVRNC